MTPRAGRGGGAACTCWKCGGPVIGEFAGIPAYGMKLCPICGNKRCPHASDHDLPCTGSNEPGQKGSVYE